MAIPFPVMGDPKKEEYEVEEGTKPRHARSDLLVAVVELSAVHDQYDSLRSDNSGSSGDAPWPGGDGNLHDGE